MPLTTNNSAPLEVISAPYDIWYAPLATAFPEIDEDPAVDWVQLGTSGSLNHTEAGITVVHSQETVQWRASGDLGTRKVFRTSESQMVRVVLADLTIEQYRLAINSNTLTTVTAASGVAGQKWIGLSRGIFVSQVALLVRGPSPYMTAGRMQYEIPICFQTGNPEVVFANRGEPAGLALEFTAVIDPSAATAAERFGRLRAMTAVAL